MLTTFRPEIIETADRFYRVYQKNRVSRIECVGRRSFGYITDTLYTYCMDRCKGNLYDEICFEGVGLITCIYADKVEKRRYNIRTWILEVQEKCCQ